MVKGKWLSKQEGNHSKALAKVFTSCVDSVQIEPFGHSIMFPFIQTIVVI